MKNDITIVVEHGLLKHHGLIYYDTKAEQILVVQFKECREEINEIIFATRFVLKQGGTVADNEMELCRFILKSGAVLRNDYQDLLH